MKSPPREPDIEDRELKPYFRPALWSAKFGNQRRFFRPKGDWRRLPAYGWSGPWAHRRGFDSLVQMSSGIAAEAMLRADADKPVPLPVQALDQATGYLMAAAVIRALRERRDTGRVMSARLSLARTAHLLTSKESALPTDPLSPETTNDLEPSIEESFWGPARRIRFPGTIDGTHVSWPRGARPVGSDPARWRNDV